MMIQPARYVHALMPPPQPPGQASSPVAQRQALSRQDVAGIWISPDGYVRLELQANGRYRENWGGRHTAYAGSYLVRDGRLVFVDADGADLVGRIFGDVLRIDRYEFRRQP